MVNEIGENAGRIWQYLNEHSPASAQEIKRSLKLNEPTLYMAVGWLARENQVVFTGEGKTMKISLAGQ